MRRRDFFKATVAMFAVVWLPELKEPAVDTFRGVKLMWDDTSRDWWRQENRTKHHCELLEAQYQSQLTEEMRKAWRDCK